MRLIATVLTVVLPLLLGAQTYSDYIGAGHNSGVLIRSSDDWRSSENLINGSGLDAELMEASRFLSQTALGADRAIIEYVAEIGQEAWMEEQFNAEPTYVLPQLKVIFKQLEDLYASQGKLDDLFGPWSLHFNYAWWQVNLTNEDLLRHRVALALSEIMVVSRNSMLENSGDGLSSYYDVLVEHAFGNYTDLLMDVTYHPAMGHYLSHLNNPRTNLVENTRPDQNYAREIMQLFTLGLYELNMDGSRKVDADGEYIPTYSEETVNEMAKVFTGLGPSEINEYVDWATEAYFGLGYFGMEKTKPLKMYDGWHEPGEKTLLNGLVLPDGQDPEKDILDAVRHLVEHPTAAPFISHKLIQRLVKSNPSPAYIERVASVFADNGEGEVGDLRAVVEAIIMDEEARECSYMMDMENGRLTEPIQRFTQVARALPKDSPMTKLWNNGFGFLKATGQHPLAAPSVFNFFLPNHQPAGDFAERNLTAPEFQIHNSRSSMEYYNQVNQWVVWDALWWSWESEFGIESGSADLDYFRPTIPDYEDFLNEMDIILTGGRLTDATREIIKTAVSQFQWGDVEYDKIRLGLYLLMISPDFAVTR